MLLERWQKYWSWLFYGLLALSTAVAVLDADGDRRRVVIVVLAAALAVWYWQAVARHGRFVVGSGLRAPWRAARSQRTGCRSASADCAVRARFLSRALAAR